MAAETISIACLYNSHELCEGWFAARVVNKETKESEYRRMRCKCRCHELQLVVL